MADFVIATRARLGLLAGLGLILGLGSFASGSCSDEGLATVVARPVVDRSDLVGGPGALGDTGDWLLANDQIRVIIQGTGFSRGFGVYGGSLIDADLNRVSRSSFGDSEGGLGQDNFSELFPALFLKAMQPRSIRADDNEDGSKSIVVNGGAGDFLKLATTINDLLAPSESLRFTNEYRLEPGKRWVEIITTIRNEGLERVELPDAGIVSFLGEGVELELPVGEVLLFGAGNDVFVEGAGFDIRFTLEDELADPPGLPQLPGLVVPFIASRGDGVSYGFASGITDPSLSLVERAGYSENDRQDLLVPFLASAFTGVFYGAAPRELASRANGKQQCTRSSDCTGGGSCERGVCNLSCDVDNPCPSGSWCVSNVCDASAFSFSKYFIVGDGDVASIRDAVHELRGAETGTFSGIVRDALTEAPEAGVEIVTFDAEGRAYNQHTASSEGRFIGTYAPGSYTYRVVSDGRPSTEPRPFEVSAGTETFLEVELDPPGQLSMRILSEDGLEMPGRCSVVGTHVTTATSVPGRDFLYDLQIGERIRPRDLTPDDPADPSTRRFVEEVLFTASGRARQPVRPGSYEVVCSRGLEYEIATVPVTIEPGRVAQVDVTLKRAFLTPGVASGDFHLHSVRSVDSTMSLDRRVAHVAAEGVDLASSSDHNFVTDYAGAVSSQGLEPWVQGMVGLEMTTLEIGHFNGFPLEYDPGPITKGAFEWSGRPPEEIFEDLRALGKYGPDKTIIQVNHPRDTIQGYFNTYGFNPDRGVPEDGGDPLFSPVGPEFGAENFTESFDALEIVNGKRRDLLFTYRVPEELPPPPLPAEVPPAGTILRDSEGKVAFPGAREDWFTYLNLGKLFTATGNSDTHGPEDEPGIPRNYFPVSDDRPGAIDELEVVEALQEQKVVITNGPYLSVSATGSGACHRLRRRDPSCSSGQICADPTPNAVCGLGEMVGVDAERRARLDLELAAASWVDVDTIRVWMNGQVAFEQTGAKPELLGARSFALEPSADAWVVVEVTGSEPMFPVIVPIEIEPIQVADAVDAIGSGFGFDLNPFGNLQPKVVTEALPYAITNPIFVDADGDGAWSPPGLTAAQRRGPIEDPRASAKLPNREDVPVLIRMFSLFSNHAH